MKTLGLIFLTAFLCAALQAADDDGLNWHSDYQKALLEAKQTNKPLLVEFRCEA
jgi:hypothetical protein